MATTTDAGTTNGFAYTSVVLGVLAALLFWVPLLSLVFGLLAMAVAWVALNRGQSRVPAIIGLTGGAFGLLANLAILLFVAV